MTNLEVVASKGLILDDDLLCAIAHVCKYGESCNDKKCSKCEFDKDIDLCVQTLIEEHKEHIKLTTLEYVFLDCLSYLGNGAKRFEYYDVTKYLLYTKGHFKGITDTSMTLQEILANCEVV